MTLCDEIIHCRLCPRLVDYRETVPAKKCFASESHWRKPVPGFGDPDAWLLILGLAPSIDGANRTGRIFTGDPSAKFLIEQLYRAGLANQPTSVSADDGLTLNGCYITPIVKCVPPAHKPTPTEIRTCSAYLQREIASLPSLRCILVLGQIALNAYCDLQHIPRPPFAHGASYPFSPQLLASYHPSPQNTNTGKLTAVSFQQVLKSAAAFQ